MELSVATRAAIAKLESATYGVSVERVWVGPFMTALDMVGLSISVLKLDGGMADALDAPLIVDESLLAQVKQEIWRTSSAEADVEALAREQAETVGTVVEKLELLLRSIRRHYPERLRVLVADDGGAPNKDLLRSLGVRYVKLPSNSGLSHGRNALVQATRTP